MSDTFRFDVTEKVDILIKQSFGFPSTDEDKQWYEETAIEYNDNFNGENLFLDTIVATPDFDTNGTVRTATEVGLSESDFYSYSANTNSKADCSIVDDSTGTVRRFKFLILDKVPGTTDNKPLSWYKPDSNNKNILQDTFQFNFKQYVTDQGDLIQPFLYKVYTQNSVTNNKTLPSGNKGGNYAIDLKSGVLFFPDYDNFTNNIQSDTTLQVSEQNKPVLTIYKYIGRKGVSKQISVKDNTSSVTDPENNQIVVQTSDNTIHRYETTTNKWVAIGGSGGNDGGSGSGSNSSSSELNAINSDLNQFVKDNDVSKTIHDSIESALYYSSGNNPFFANCSLNKNGTKIVISKEFMEEVNPTNPIFNTLVYEYNNDGLWCRAGDAFCYSRAAALNDEGNIVAIISDIELLDTDGNSFSPERYGVMQLYERDYNSLVGWKQIYGDVKLNIEVSSASDRPFMRDIKVNSLGNIIVFNIGNQNVHIYERNTSLNRFDKIGEYPGAISPSINSEGNIISVTEVKDEGNNTFSGIVKIFERENNYINNAISQMNGWKQLGPDISIASPNSFGNKTDLDSSGKIICISDENYGNQNLKGNVYVYKLSDNNDSWVQVGNTIEGLQQEHLGCDINLNSDGTILAVLSYYLFHFNYSYQHPNRSLLNDTQKFFKNEIKVYEKHTTSTGTVEWKLLGEPIRSIKNNENGLNDFRPLTYLSMSKDGKILACNNGIYTIKTSKIMNNLVAPNINVSNNISTKNVIFNQVEDNYFPTNLIIRDRYNLKIQEFTKKDIIDFILDNHLFTSIYGAMNIHVSFYKIANKIIISDNFAVLLLQSISRMAQDNFIVIFEKKCMKWELKNAFSYLNEIDDFFFLTEKDSDRNFYGTIQVYFKAGATPVNQQNTAITTNLKFIKYNSFEDKWSKKIDSNTNTELELTGLQVFNTSKNFATRSNFIQCENTNLSGKIYNLDESLSFLMFGDSIFNFNIANNFNETSIDSNNQYKFSDVQMITDKFVILRIQKQNSNSEYVNLNSIFTFKNTNSVWNTQAIEKEFGFDILNQWLHYEGDKIFLTIFYSNDDFGPTYVNPILETYTFDENLNNWKKITTLSSGIISNVAQPLKNLYVNGRYAFVVRSNCMIVVFKLFNINILEKANWEIITDVESKYKLYGVVNYQNNMDINDKADHPFVSTYGDLVVIKEARTEIDGSGNTFTLEEKKISFLLAIKDVKIGPFENDDYLNRFIRIDENKIGIKKNFSTDVNYEIDVDGDINFTGNLYKNGVEYGLNTNEFYDLKVNNELKINSGLKIRNHEYSLINYIPSSVLKSETKNIGYGFDIFLSNKYLIVGSPNYSPHGAIEIWVLRDDKVSFNQMSVNEDLNKFVMIPDATDGVESFGTSVHIEDESDFAVVGAPKNTTTNSTERAYVYKIELKNVNGINYQYWKLVAQLNPFGLSNRGNDDKFAETVYIKFPYVFVGAPGYNTEDGEIAIYKYNDSTSSFEHPVSSNNGGGYGIDNHLSRYVDLYADNGRLGTSIDIENNFLIAGLPGANGGVGMVKIMKSHNGRWSHSDLQNVGNTVYTITNPDYEPNTAQCEFGNSVACYGNYLVIGSPFEDSGKGSIYLYKYENDNWIKKDKAFSRNITSGDYFGNTVDINKKNVVVGTNHTGPNTTENGGLFYLIIDDNDKLIHVTPRIQHIGLQQRGIGLANVSISDYLVAAGSPNNNSEPSQWDHKGEINFYQIKSSVRVTDFVIPNFERTFIGTAGGSMKVLNMRKGNDYFFNKYSSIYNEISGIPLNIGAGSTFGKYLDALLDFEPRYIRDGPGIIMDTQVLHNIAGNFWYSVYKDFKDNQDINTLPWRVGGNELNSETEITNSNWGSTYFKTKKNVKINRICSILIFKITSTNQQPKSDVIANIRTENGYDKLEVFSTTDELDNSVDNIVWTNYVYESGSTNENTVSIIKDNESENVTYMLIYYKDYAYDKNTDNVEIIFNDVNMSFNNNENSVKIMNSSFYDETYNYSTFYNKDKFITENEIRFAPGFSSNDLNLLRVDSYDGTTNSGNYGFTVKYRGKRSGNLNSLAFLTDNQRSNSQIEALSILQDGNVGINIDEPNAKLHVNGSTNLDGNTKVTKLKVGDTTNLDNSSFKIINSNEKFVQMDNSIFNTNYNDNGDGTFFNGNGHNGSSVRFNNEGNIMAISCHKNSPDTKNKGIVKVFQYSGASWSRLGDDSMLIGQQNQEQFGINMDINGKGNIIAIGGQGRPDPGGGSNIPATVCYVKVFEWDGTSWNQRGATFDQPISCYFSLSISDDGNTVGFGDRYYESSDQGSTYAHGTIRIYEWDGTNYVQKTNPDDFKGNSSRTWYTGTNFKMNKTGTKFVYSHYNGSNFRLIAYHKEGSSWVYKKRLDGNVNSAYNSIDFGWDDDGNEILAYTLSSYKVRVLKYVNGWYVKGSDIPVPSSQSQNNYGFGQEDSISIYGNKIVIGNRAAGSNSTGAVMLYTFENGSYQLSKTIEGERAYMNFGSCVRFNKNGSILAMMQRGGVGGYFPHYIGYLYCTKSYSMTGNLEVKGNLNVSGTITTNKIKNENNFDIDIEENTISFKLYNREISKITNVGSPYYTSFTQTASNTQHGYSVAISDSDTEPVVVVGQPDYFDNGTAYVYQFNGYQWVNISNADIMKGDSGDNNSSEAGTSVAISGDGTVIAVAAPNFKSSADNVGGRLKIFKRTGSSYKLIGTLDGKTQYYKYPTSISLNYNGHLLAVGNKETDSSTGEIQLYRYSDTSESFSRIVNDSIDYEGMGKDIAINNNGDTFVVSDSTSWVRIYRDPYGNDNYIYYTTDIKVDSVNSSSTNYNDNFGSSVAISGDGKVVAIGSPDAKNVGRVYTYRFKYNVYGSTFEKFGENDAFEGRNIDAKAGTSISLNYDGTIIAVGAPGTLVPNTSNRLGEVYIYKWNGSKWSKITNIWGTWLDKKGGFSVSLNGAGNTLVMGSKGSGEVKLIRFLPYNDIPLLTTKTITAGDSNESYGSDDLQRNIKINSNITVGLVYDNRDGFWIGSSGNYGNGNTVIKSPFIQGLNRYNAQSNIVLNPIGGKIGIGTDTPGSTLHIKAISDSNNVNAGLKSHSSYALTMERYGTTDTWSLLINSSGSTNHNDLNFLYNGNRKGYLDEAGNGSKLNFTGQHRNIINNAQENSVGLIVISNGKYINLDNNMKPSINESLPICELSNKEKDKRVFGVISDKEDYDRVYTNGVWASVFDKANVNEKRYFINSVGEGGMWVCNTNGDLENGDYITTSNVSGYGQKQDDDLLHSFTVAKITCDCNFSLIKENQKQIKTIQKEKIVDDILKDESGNIILDTSGNETIIQKTITEQELVFDNSGNVIIEDKQDTSGNTIEDYPYDIRFLLPDGTIISEEEYLTLNSNNKVCYIAYFVGVTYHCG